MDTDLALLDRWCSGDSAAGNQLVLRHFDSLYRFFDNKLGSDIDELIQTTFLACVRSRDQFRRQSSFRTYLFTIARHELYRHLRERQRHRQDIDVDEMSILDLGTSPTGKLARSQEHKLLLFALRSLSVEQQVLLELHYWESMSTAELAEVFVSNPYTYVPTVNLRMLGRPTCDARSSQGQLTALLVREGPQRRLVQAQVFSYRSLLTFKLMKELPLAARFSRQILQSLMPSFTILGIHHEDRPSATKTCALQRRAAGQPDVLHIDYRPSAAEQRMQHEDESALLACFLRLGCLPLKRIRPGHGSSIHYAGTFPITTEDRPLTCDRDSRLRGTQRVYLADGSVFSPTSAARILTSARK